MGTLDFEILEDTFAKNSSPSYNLSLLISEDRLSYMITTKAHGLLVLRRYAYPQQEPAIALPDLLKPIFGQDELLGLPYGKVRIALSYPAFSLIPKRLYDPTQKALYLKNLTAGAENMQLFSDSIETLEIQNVFGIKPSVENTLLQHFPNAGLHHCHSALILGFHSLAAKQKNSTVFLNVQHRNLQILAFEGDKLLLCNSFRFRHPNDFIYYVMMVYDQLRLDPEEVAAGLAGQIVEDSRIYHLLYRYIRHLYKIRPPEYLQFGKQFASTARHFHFDLYSILLCE